MYRKVGESRLGGRLDKVELAPLKIREIWGHHSRSSYPLALRATFFFLVSTPASNAALVLCCPTNYEKAQSLSNS